MFLDITVCLSAYKLRMQLSPENIEGRNFCVILFYIYICSAFVTVVQTALVFIINNLGLGLSICASVSSFLPRP